MRKTGIAAVAALSILPGMLGRRPYPAALHDTKNAIRWLRTNAAKYRVESDRILVWGASAGGELAGLAATTCGATELEPPISDGRGRPERAISPAAAPSDCVQAAVLWYAASDLEAAANPPPGSADARGGAQRGGGGGPRDYLGCTPPNIGPKRR